MYFHPLRRFPGPKLAAATGLLFSYKILRGDEIAWETEMHKKYGEIVRIGPDRLTFITPEAWKDIAGPALGKRLENRKDPAMIPGQANGDRSLGGEVDTEKHRPRRRVYAHAFSDRALREQEPLIQGYVDFLVKVIKEDLKNNPDIKMDISKLLNCCTFDVMADLTFGEPLGLLQQSEYTPWVASIFQKIRNISIGRLAIEYRAVAFLFRWFTPARVKEGAKQHFQHSAERVEKRLRRGNDIGKPDIWKLVMENEKNPIPKQQMIADATGFMIAGTETTATTLTALLYYLLQHPQQMQRLQDEVRSLNEEELNLETLSPLPFMNACIKESMRMYPAAPLALFRRVPKGGNVICGKWLPENTRVAVPHYAAYHHPLNFKDPDSFIPDRWFPGTGYDDDRKDIHNPFSVGPRNCIGQNLANHEMRILLASIIWNFDFELCPECENWDNQKVHFVWAKPPLLVKARYIR